MCWEAKVDRGSSENAGLYQCNLALPCRLDMSPRASDEIQAAAGIDGHLALVRASAPSRAAKEKITCHWYGGAAQASHDGP
jgi:hypothetical protein